MVTPEGYVSPVRSSSPASTVELSRYESQTQSWQQQELDDSFITNLRPSAPGSAHISAEQQTEVV